MFLLVFLTIFFSIFSQVVMSHLAINFSLGPWVGPIFVVVSMSVVLPLIAKEWFRKHAMVIVTSSSIGGVIGLGLGVAVPAFYFLDRHTFLALYEYPYLFSVFISLVVGLAVLSAFFVAYSIKDYFIENDTFVFPMSHSMYRLIEGQEYSEEHKKIWYGILSAGLWNALIYIVSFSVNVAQFLTKAPFSIAIGFITGTMLFKPLCIGLLVKFGYIYPVYDYFFPAVHLTKFLALFSFGMLSVHVVQFFYTVFQTHNAMKHAYKVIVLFLQTNRTLVWVMMIIFALLVLSFWWIGIGIIEQCFIYVMLLLSALSSASLVGTLGIVSVQGFVWSIILPLVYAGILQADIILYVACFAIVFLNVVSDLIFSYKIVRISSYTYADIITYQIVAALAAIITSGVWMWLYAHYFAGFSLFEAASSAKNLDGVIAIGSFHSMIFVAGVICAIGLWLCSIEILNIVGVIFTSSEVAFWLLIASGCSLFVKNRQEWTSYWFGVYAMHALWSICILLVT